MKKYCKPTMYLVPVKFDVIMVSNTGIGDEQERDPFIQDMYEF